MDIMLPIAVLMILYLYIDQVRRLVAHAMLNATIRKALAADPASVPLLVAKIESGPRGLAGWVTVALGIGLAVAAILDRSADNTDLLQAAAVVFAVGIALTGWDWWMRRSTPKPD